MTRLDDLKYEVKGNREMKKHDIIEAIGTVGSMIFLFGLGILLVNMG